MWGTHIHTCTHILLYIPQKPRRATLWCTKATKRHHDVRCLNIVRPPNRPKYSPHSSTASTRSQMVQCVFVRSGCLLKQFTLCYWGACYNGLRSVGSWSGLWLSSPPSVVSLGLWGGRLVRIGVLHDNIINFYANKVYVPCYSHSALWWSWFLNTFEQNVYRTLCILEEFVCSTHKPYTARIYT